MSTTTAHHHDLEISGMSCASCVGRVEKALTSVAGVKAASVNLVTKQARAFGDRIPPRSLIDAVTKAGYGARLASSEHHAHHDSEDAGRAFLVAAVLGLPLLVAGMAHGAVPWMETQAGRWLQLVIATVVVFGAGSRFFVAAFAALRHRTSDMNTLVALGSAAAWGYSAVAVIAPGLFPHAEHGVVPHVYFEAAVAIVGFVLLGRYLEARSLRRLQDAVSSLVALQPKTARLVGAAGDSEVAAESLVPGALIRVRPGESVAADGEVVEGHGVVDEAMLTGESMPVAKQAGASVFAGTVNRGAPFTVRVTHAPSGSTLARIARAVADAQSSRAPIARLADVVAGYFVPIVIGIALLTLVIWLFVEPAVALERFVAVLIIACPCALGLATPAAVAAATGRGAELGVLIKGGAPLELLSRVDTVLLDKTGTLTTGKPLLTDVVADGLTDHELLRLAAAVERDSEHPIASAIVGAASELALPLEAPSDVVVEAGAGVAARVGGHDVRVGTAAWLATAGVDPSPLTAPAERLAALGRTVTFVSVDGRAAGVLAVADRPRASSVKALRALARQGVELVMVSGDREATARAIAKELGIERVIAGVLPEDKARVVGQERASGKSVAMVGDGINDAPALAAADVGVAVSTGTDIAVAAADVNLTREGIAGLPTALALARATMAVIRQNLFWAFVYNVVGIPIAAGALYAWTGWLLSPVLASMAMSLSSISVILNSLRLRRFGRKDGVS
ncbi:MAG TPA: heavy metal translocating P-type ATPase [Myxococcota bacterium]|nr:heavy metal translocating P-type ATPase [Myxococcota bacterium]